jgi:hypothetical protein
MDGKIELEEVALEGVDVNEFIDRTTPDGGRKDRISGGRFL